MKVTYDPVADAMSIYFNDRKKSTKTVELNGDFLADYAGKELISLEILDVSKKLPREQLMSIRPESSTSSHVTRHV